MKLRLQYLKNIIAVAVASAVLTACATAPTVSAEAVAARANLNRLQADADLASLARVEIMDAEQAVSAAERPTSYQQLSEYLLMMAETKIEIARFWAQSRFYEDQREVLNAEAEAVRLNARTLEAERAQSAARLARSETARAEAATVTARRETELAQNRTQAAQGEAELARTDASTARGETETAQAATVIALREIELAQNRTQAAQGEAELARTDASTARGETETAQAATVTSRRETEQAQNRTRTAEDEAELARTATGEARAETTELQRQLTELNATITDRGLVVTLGDIMFETGSYELRGGTSSDLDKLATFLTRYENRTVEIEGHTDSIGTADSNLILSRQRAGSVTDYLIAQGINSIRLTTSGKGEDMPVADNGTSTGRQQNRRVEVIISNEEAPSP